MQTRKLRWVLAGVVAFASGVGLVTYGCFLLERWLDPFEARQFDAASWAGSDWKGRAAMARDAIRHLPAGTPEADVVQLLGKPGYVIETKKLVGLVSGPPLPRFSGSAPAGSVRTYSYGLGSWGWAGYDDTFLWVHVDGEGRVVAAVVGGG
jgi:hypothetical protein